MRDRRSTAWLTAADPQGRLSGIPDDDLQGLMLAARSWAAANMAGEAAYEVTDATRDDDGGIAAKLTIRTPDGSADVAASTSGDGVWTVTRAEAEGGGQAEGEPAKPEATEPEGAGGNGEGQPRQGSATQGAAKAEPEGDGTAAPDERLAVPDPKALARAMPEDAAREVSRQFLASGIDGAASAWATAGTVRSEGGVTRARLSVPARDGRTDPYDVSYDAGWGVLQICPAGAGR